MSIRAWSGMVTNIRYMCECVHTPFSFKVVLPVLMSDMFISSPQVVIKSVSSFVTSAFPPVYIDSIVCATLKL